VKNLLLCLLKEKEKNNWKKDRCMERCWSVWDIQSLERWTGDSVSHWQQNWADGFCSG